MAFFLLLMSTAVQGLQERHAIFIRQGGEIALTPEGKIQTQRTGEILLTHGFDNRSICAVYVAKDKGSQTCAEQLAQMGIFDKKKIHRQNDIDLVFYQGLESKHLDGHVIIIDDNTDSIEILEKLADHEVDKTSYQPYILPFTTQKA